MRLNRLDLIRYGRFQDAEIVFPKPASGAPDVTVIFGPNEAGKSTAFHGFLELLFGFRSGTHPYAFRFERSDLLVGADLDLPGRGSLVLRRNSKRTQSLLDADDRPVNDAVVAGALHGLSREAYEERFSLNEAGLREGGKRIAAAQGDLGQLLHAGLSGLTGMAETLDALSDRADKFHKKRARGTVVKLGNDRLKEIGRTLRDGRLTDERERSLRRDRDRADAEFETADSALRQSKQRQAAGQAAQVWYERTQEMTQLEGALTSFPEGPDLDPGAAARVAGLVEKIAAQTARIKDAETEIAKQGQVVAENAVDELAQSLSSELDRLDQMTIDDAPLMSRATTARTDLARRSEARDALARQIDTVLAKLGISDVLVSAIALTPAALEEIDSAIQTCLQDDLSAKAAQDAVIVAQDQLGDAPDAPQDLSALRAAFEAWKLVENITSLQVEHDTAAARLVKAKASLPGTWHALIDAGLPARETLDDVAREWSSLIAELASARTDASARAVDLQSAQADLATLEAAPDAVDIAMTEKTRRQRDMAWQHHRNDLSAATAAGFEAAMFDDDGTRAHYLTGAEMRQRLVATQGQVRTAAARAQTANDHLNMLVEDQDRLTARCSALAGALGLDPGTSPSAFGARQQALGHAGEAAADLANAQDALKARLAHQQAARDVLQDAADTVGLNGPVGNLAAPVQQVLTLEDTARQSWGKWQDGQKTLDRLKRASEDCRAASDAAAGKLGQLTAALPLGDRTLKGLALALPSLRSLQQLTKDYRDISDRVAALEQAIATLSDASARLARIMDIAEDEAAGDPIVIIDQTRARLTASGRADEKRNEAESGRDAANRAKGIAEDTCRDGVDDLARCFEGQGAADLAPQDRVAKLVARDGLRGEHGAADRARLRAREGVDAALFGEELGRLPDAVRAGDLEQALSDAQDARDAARDAQRDSARIYREAYEAADLSDLATEQATLLEELRSGARQAAVARLGVLAARGALRRLAQERRSEMLRDVENAFVTMTAPAWTGVDVWSHAEGDKLVGIQPGGNTVPIEHMSTGTMGQLYFALRLAGYRSFSRDPGPLPMILDDIMETFDDTRAGAALQLCAQIGENGQAILFTHHAHLVALAQEILPDVNIVQMPSR